jgi:heterogeneous nuclear ribonucleoprotein F/H
MQWVRENTRFWEKGYDDFPDKEAVVGMKNLPFGCSKEEIVKLFTGLEIKPQVIILNYQSNGNSSGGAFVEFANKESVDEAMKKQNEIRDRSIEIFNFK